MLKIKFIFVEKLIDMKKILLNIFVLTLMVVGFTSCKKCTTCSVTYPTKAANGTTGYTRPEYCGNSWQVKSYENSFYAAWSVKGDISCERK